MGDWEEGEGEGEVGVDARGLSVSRLGKGGLGCGVMVYIQGL